MGGHWGGFWGVGGTRYPFGDKLTDVNRGKREPKPSLTGQANLTYLQLYLYTRISINVRSKASPISSFRTERSTHVSCSKNQFHNHLDLIIIGLTVLSQPDLQQ